MTNSQRLQLVRQRIFQWLGEHGLPVTEQTTESILIRDGFYCGRRFKVDQCTAIWFTEDDQVKIYNSENHLLASFQVAPETPATIRRAA